MNGSKPDNASDPVTTWTRPLESVCEGDYLELEATTAWTALQGTLGDLRHRIPRAADPCYLVRRHPALGTGLLLGVFGATGLMIWRRSKAVDGPPGNCDRRIITGGRSMLVGAVRAILRTLASAWVSRLLSPRPDLAPQSWPAVDRE